METGRDKFKVVMLGDFAVGKTSMVKRCVYDVFDDMYLTTIGVKVSKKELPLAGEGASKRITLVLWDIGSLAEFKVQSSRYLEGARGAVVVADLTRVATITQLETYVQLFLSVNPGGTVAIAFNKLDLFAEPEFPGKIDSFMESYRSRFGAESFRTSAKTGENVENLFSFIAGKLGSGAR